MATPIAFNRFLAGEDIVELYPNENQRFWEMMYTYVIVKYDTDSLPILVDEDYKKYFADYMRFPIFPGSNNAREMVIRALKYRSSLSRGEKKAYKYRYYLTNRDRELHYVALGSNIYDAIIKLDAVAPDVIDGEVEEPFEMLTSGDVLVENLLDTVQNGDTIWVEVYDIL